MRFKRAKGALIHWAVALGASGAALLLLYFTGQPRWGALLAWICLMALCAILGPVREWSQHREQDGLSGHSWFEGLAWPVGSACAGPLLLLWSHA